MYNRVESKSDLIAVCWWDRKMCPNPTYPDCQTVNPFGTNIAASCMCMWERDYTWKYTALSSMVLFFFTRVQWLLIITAHLQKQRHHCVPDWGRAECVATPYPRWYNSSRWTSTKCKYPKYIWYLSSHACGEHICHRYSLGTLSVIWDTYVSCSATRCTLGPFGFM